MGFIAVDRFEGMAKCHGTSCLDFDKMKETIASEGDEVYLSFTDSPISIQNFITASQEKVRSYFFSEGAYALVAICSTYLC